MHRGDRVVPRRQSSGKREPTVSIRNRKPRMINDADVGKHPGMNLAFELNEYFGPIEGKRSCHPSHRLPNVLLFVAGLPRQRMNIVQNRIGIPHLENLSRLHSQDIRLKFATNLIEQRSLRDWSSRGRAVLDVDKGVGQSAFGINNIMTCRKRSPMKPATKAIRHDALFRRRRAVQHDTTDHGDSALPGRNSRATPNWQNSWDRI